ncbi:LacI family DNA-binding transcriptional regulator [Aliiglaciecola sp. LCG003]|uniref:LacI family DNA-binding transcriptional regulator n=1 Tax=Aliiglaciecola sp. LCG003 TaxID=3053655 RepID=UPI0025734BF6|nr:LacI family DNA-binding transcriptional regulator [Aliiglaciecola sp. LCG003]WJG08067.1 LacI family DNA-binding transcriptional regulator [Aliiglaciecola sp. LCG003]
MASKIRKLSDLAKLAGVSESTASRALNNNSLISQKTRQKIQAIAAEHGFKINTAARNLRLQKSNTIAVVIIKSSEFDQSITDPFMLNFVGVIAQELTTLKYDVLLVSLNINQDIQLADFFDMKRADGLIVFGQGDDIKKFDSLINPSYPIVVWGAPSPNQSYPTVGTDNFLGGELATKHLIEQNCQNIVFSGWRSFETSQRYAGYQKTLQQHQLTAPAPLDIHFNYDDAYQVTLELIKQGKFDYDGVVAASDTIALGMIRALNESGIDIPNQVAITGYDDISVAAYTQPALTSIKQDTAQAGKLLVDSLIALMANEQVISTMMPTELIIRQSSQRKK